MDQGSNGHLTPRPLTTQQIRGRGEEKTVIRAGEMTGALQSFQLHGKRRTRRGGEQRSAGLVRCDVAATDDILSVVAARDALGALT